MTAAPWPAAVGVSGGSDSIALMLLLRDWAKAQRVPPPLVLCVDHGLRPGSAAEARQVVRWAKAADLTARVLTYQGPPPQSDVEAAARQLRYDLMGAAARKAKLAAVYVAHTQDDQAETVLMRLARGSGVDGMAGMRVVAPYPAPEHSGLVLVRPLLGMTRLGLRAWLEEAGQSWLDDPMNGDPRFLRVRIRQAWPLLESLGFSRQRLADTATHFARARQALELATAAVLNRTVAPVEGGLLLDSEALAAAPPELGLRVLAAVLSEVSGALYRPRFERLQALYAAIGAGTAVSGRTLQGCRIGRAPRGRRDFGPQTLLITREKGRKNKGKPQGNKPIGS